MRYGYNRHSIFGLLLFSCLLLLQISCGSSSTLQLSGLQLTARQFTGTLNKTEAMAAVNGAATNTRNVAIKDCTISVTFFDEGKKIIGIASTARESMLPGEIWNFTVQLTNSDAWKARTYDISSSNR